MMRGVNLRRPVARGKCYELRAAGENIADRERELSQSALSLVNALRTRPDQLAQPET